MSKLGSLLVVDDDTDLRDAVASILAEHGYHVQQATEGRHALEVLKTFKPDLVITDLMMPVMTGYELIDAIKGTVPIVVMSANRMTMDHPSLVGIQGFLAKPFELDALFQTVADAIVKN